MSRVDNDLKEKFQALVSLPFKKQATWFLNGFWKDVEREAENIWSYVHTCQDLDKEGKGNGAELDEFQAHRFLEKLGETLSVKEMRDKMREIDLDFNKRMAISEYFIFKYKKTARQVVNAPQGGPEQQAELVKAQAMVDDAQQALEAVQNRLLEERKAEAAAKQAEAEAKSALDELHAQEKAFNDKVEELTRKSQEGGTVSKGKASNELEQLKAEDPLPLRRAKINQAATVRKVERARKEAEETAANTAKAQAEAEGKFLAANKYLEEIQAKGGDACGDIWWLQREMTEKKKYLPRSRQ